MTNELLKKVDISKIADKGNKIYEKIKSKYVSTDVGKFLAIEVDTRNVYLAKTSVDAVEIARKKHPKKVFYVVKIGSSASEILSHLKLNSFIPA